MILDRTALLKEIIFKTSRSGGKGGQNVNKVSSKVELIFNIKDSTLFNEEQKQLICEKLATKLDSEAKLHMVCQEDRSQLLNKQKVILKFMQLIEQALKVEKKRKPTKTPQSVIEKRLNSKSVMAIKKENRRKPDLE